MTDIAIKVEDLSKLYRLGEIGTGTLSHDLNRWFAKIRGREDPFAKVSQIDLQENDNTSPKEIWALRDINFEVKKGEVLGIIGRNGAGKSTLLKILSKITKPTTGKIKLNGKIASLLEVGTGFHQEMTGRENIFLNGAILGMTRTEIKSKFDEIVEFSGVEKFIDTPVKRYSSGMYVRLAFAVAAHLEPDILIVDEVLAVGDAAFQNKCIGKMKDVSERDGRTVLFVSHNMAAILNLCNNGILIDSGRILDKGYIQYVVNKYLNHNQNESNKDLAKITDRKGNQDLLITFGVVEGVEAKRIKPLSDIKITLRYKLKEGIQIKNFRIDIGINNTFGQRVAWMSSYILSELLTLNNMGTFEFYIKKNPLIPGDYNCNIYCEINSNIADWMKEVLPFTIVESNYYQSGKTVPANQGNMILDYKIQSI